MEFFATCPTGFEQLLAHELRMLGTQQVRPLRGQVSFAGAARDAYRACLWSRLASRVVAVLARGGAQDADELYATVAEVAWEEQLSPGASFAIDAHGTNQQLRNTQFVALRAKDAVTDRVSSQRGARPISDPAQPDLRIIVRITREHAVVGVDLAGEPLFRRGYEAPRGSRTTVVPLRADYAAALLALGDWGELCAAGEPTLIAPFSGAGTLATEAAAQALDRAPGLLRQRWGFEGWGLFEPAAWEELLSEAHARAEAAAHRPLRLLLSDTRPRCDMAARQALRAAGMHLEPQFSQDPSKLSLAHGAARQAPTLLACDLSWLDETVPTQAAALAQVAAAAHAAPEDTCATVLATSSLTDAVLGPASQTVGVLIGRDEGTLRKHERIAPDAAAHVSLPGRLEADVLVPASNQFAARLAKVAKQRRKWAAREDVSCYRVYDADLPDYNVSIDLFEGSLTPGRWLQIYEYAPPKGVDATLAQARLLDVVALAPRLLDVKPENTFVRVRTKARGGSQYANEAQPTKAARAGTGRVTHAAADERAQGHRQFTRPGGRDAQAASGGKTPLPAGAHLVDEGGLTFEVNFSLRLDCGIFLDHRDTRAMLREMAKQTKGSKRFLNLFAYTGTGSCYAADGGMRYTTTVDLSRPSLDWARRNMERNGFIGKEHEYVQADVIAWVSEQRRTKNRWDLVFCDVPTFSNSQRMRTASFDVQRDHAELLIGVSRLLTREGTCVFSCNLRGFRIDTEALAKAGVVAEDITAQTIPEDFSRNPRIHKCYLVRRTPRDER